MRQLQGVERGLRGLLEVSGGTTTLITIGESNLSTMKDGCFIESKIEERLFLFLTKVTVRPVGLRIGMASTDTAPPKVDFDSHKAQIGGLKVAVVRSCLGVLASSQEATIPLRYWVDNEQKRVVMAEASGDFVDVLFSFLIPSIGNYHPAWESI
ncbi:hypothetical protein D0Y65_017068 [Glycine soja]|uniref:Uncharacterized protein n=1 Tax=Glycine soja TaxID=3848 RepID=A0A445JT76_GLYSO|nr:hypothetical protein D0Y65_017068 [Glycine soja]